MPSPRTRRRSKRVSRRRRSRRKHSHRISRRVRRYRMTEDDRLKNVTDLLNSKGLLEDARILLCKSSKLEEKPENATEMVNSTVPEVYNICLQRFLEHAELDASVSTDLNSVQMVNSYTKRMRVTFWKSTNREKKTHDVELCWVGFRNHSRWLATAKLTPEIDGRSTVPITHYLFTPVDDMSTIVLTNEDEFRKLVEENFNHYGKLSKVRIRCQNGLEITYEVTLRSSDQQLGGDRHYEYIDFQPQLDINLPYPVTFIAQMLKFPEAGITSISEPVELSFNSETEWKSFIHKLYSYQRVEKVKFICLNTNILYYELGEGDKFTNKHEENDIKMSFKPDPPLDWQFERYEIITFQGPMEGVASSVAQPIAVHSKPRTRPWFSKHFRTKLKRRPSGVVLKK